MPILLKLPVVSQWPLRPVVSWTSTLLATSYHALGQLAVSEDTHFLASSIFLLFYNSQEK